MSGPDHNMPTKHDTIHSLTRSNLVAGKHDVAEFSIVSGAFLLFLGGHSSAERPQPILTLHTVSITFEVSGTTLATVHRSRQRRDGLVLPCSQWQWSVTFHVGTVQTSQ